MRVMTRKKIIGFLGKKVTPSVTAPGDINLSDDTAGKSTGI